MAVLVVQINASEISIDEFNARIMRGEKRSDILRGLMQYLNELQAGAKDNATVQVTSRDTAVSVATSGTDSVQVTITR